MKLPSLYQCEQEFKRIFARFPLIVIDAVLGTIAAMNLIEREGPAQPAIFIKILMTSVLGFILLLGLALIAEKRSWSRSQRIASQAGGVLLLFAYGCSLPAMMDGAPEMHMVRFLILGMALVLFVSVAPFAGTREQNGFWHHNKAIMIRILITIFYAVVLQIGLSVALAALDQLFGIDIPGKRYGELWILIVGLFSTSFFLAGVPEDLNALEQESDYPKGLRIFAQYILSAVVLVYLVILYAYLAKIVIAWSWPQGWVSKLILGFSATGLAALLLLWPVREQEENKWGRLAWRWFFIVLIPMVIMLPLAVWRRISDYGLTEGRYLAIVLALYLAILVIYFTAGKVKNIKVIPGLLGIIALLVCYGPWSVFSVPEKSQKGRLQTLLADNAILVEGQIRKAPKAVSTENAAQISSIVAYLHDMHGYAAIQPWFKEKLVQETDGKTVRLKPGEVTALMGIEYMRGARSSLNNERSLNVRGDGHMEIAGYDYLLTNKFIGDQGLEIELLEKELSCKVNPDLNSMTLLLQQDGIPVDTLRVDLRGAAEKLYRQFGRTNPDDIPLEKAAFSAESARIRVRIYLRHTLVEVKGDEIKPLKYTIDILYAIR